MPPCSRRILTSLAGFFFAVASTANAQEETPREDALPAEVMREFSQVYGLIRKNYVDDVDEREVLRDAIRGMVRGLDQHSSYIDEEQLEEFTNSLQGNFGGVGIFIDVDRNIIRVVSPIEDSPAWRAGLQANDYVIRIDDIPTEGMDVGDAANLMRGEPGTLVTLSIVRLGEESREDFDVELERQIIRSPSVRSAKIDDNYGYLRINQFLRVNRTPKEVVEHVDDLIASNNGKLDGLVIDLRGNPGGDLGSSLCVASIFLKQGQTVVANRGRNVDRIYKSDLRDCHTPKSIQQTRELNLVVLVNKGSASASEILAGAFQDNDRGIIVGTNTFGKASVQQIYNLEATDYKSAVKLTSARYYTPSGKSIHEVGIEPDVVVEYVPPPEDAQAELPEEMTAEELSNLKEIARKQDIIIPTDNQFLRALEILREMNVS